MADATVPEGERGLLSDEHVSGAQSSSRLPRQLPQQSTGLTVGELAAAMRLSGDDLSPPSAPQLGILQRDLLTAVDLIDIYAPDAPAHVKDEAAIRLAGYLYDQSPTGSVSQNPFRHSGAMALLSKFHVSPGVTV